MAKKKEWHINIDQNGGEYVGWAKITAVKVKKINETTLEADGVKIQFDERIDEPVISTTVKP